MKVYLDLFDYPRGKTRKPKRISIVKMLRRRRLVFEQKDGQRVEVQVAKHGSEEIIRVTAIDGYLELRPSSSNVIQLRSVKF